MPFEASSEYTLDVELGYYILDGLQLVVGAQNVTNEYPDENPYARDFGARYAETSPMGFNGGFYYSKLTYSL